MDLHQIIRALHEERKRLDRIIQRIQELQEPANARPQPRGRRGASAEDGSEISRRVKRGASRRPPPQPPHTL